MKKVTILTLSGLVALALASGCKEQTPQVSPEKKVEAPAAQQTAQAPQQQAAGQGMSGTVTETMDSGGYTYVQVDTGTEKVWAAAPQLQVEVGDSVVIPQGMAMQNYHSKTLDRTFETVYFVDSVLVGGEQAMAAAQGGMPEGHPSLDVAQNEEMQIDFSGLEKAENGKTVQEIFSNKEELAGKEVTLRAKVVKFNPQIMNKNWLHLQDGTGETGTNDLTVTTDTGTSVNVGDTVLVTGSVTTDKDLGSGYYYDVILEDANVVVE